MKKNLYLIVTIISAMVLFPGCKDDAFYGSEPAGGSKTTVGFSGPEKTEVIINSFDGTPKFEESVVSIPVKIYSPLKEDVTVKLMQNDALLDTYYKDSRFGLSAFPEGVFEVGCVVIPAGKTESSVNISLRNAKGLTNEGEYLAAFGMLIESVNPQAVQVFGVQYHFVKAVQKRAENIAELSINKQEISLTANNPRETVVLRDNEIRFTITTSVAQDRNVTLRLQNNPLLLDYFYKGDRDGFMPFPQGVLEDIVVEIPAGETQTEVVLPFAFTEKLIDEPGYLAAFKLKEISEDKKYVSASDDSYFFVKVKQTISVALGNRYAWGGVLDKAEIKAYANGGSELVPAVIDGNNSGDYFEISKSNNGSLELQFESLKTVRDLTLHTNAKESEITSFYVAVTVDNGATWLPRGLVDISKAEDSFNISFLSYSMKINGIKIYGVKGTGSGLKVYETIPYVSRW